MAEFVPVATLHELSPGQGKLVEVKGKRIALFNLGGGNSMPSMMCARIVERLSL